LAKRLTFPQPEVVPEAVIIMPHTSGGISNIMLDRRYVKV